MAVKFALKDKSKTHSPVKAVMWYKGKRYIFATGLTVESKHWLPSSHKCSTKREYPEGRANNLILDKIQSKLIAQFAEYAHNFQIPSTEQARSDFNQSIYDKVDSQSFTVYLKKQIDKCTLNERTIKKYTTTYNKLIRYEKSTNTRLTFESINISFYKSFRKWIAGLKDDEGNPMNYTLNYFGTLIQVIQTFMNKSSLDGLHSFTGHKHPDFKTVEENADSIYLSNEELLKIHDFKPSEDIIRKFIPEITPYNLSLMIKSMEICKSRFLLGAFTALRVSDFNRLSSIHVGDKFIRIKPKKGTKKNNDVVIPIHPVVREILEGYDLSEKVTEQKINKQIKQVCKMAGIDELVEVSRTLADGKLQTTTVPKYELVSTHTARRSAATNMYKMKIPSISIMKVTGHTTEKSFLKYIKLSNEQNAELLASHIYYNPH